MLGGLTKTEQAGFLWSQVEDGGDLILDGFLVLLDMSTKLVMSQVSWALRLVTNNPELTGAEPSRSALLVLRVS